MKKHEGRCDCGNCCGCKGVHDKGFCPYPKCMMEKLVSVSQDEIAAYKRDPFSACVSLRNRYGVGMMDAKRLFDKAVAKSEAPAKVADIMRLSDTPKPKKPEAESNLVAVDQEVNNPHPDLREEGRLIAREDQQVSIESALASGYSNAHVGEYGSIVASRSKGPEEAPRMSDFYLIDSTMTAEAMLKLISDEVFGNYDPVPGLVGNARFGVIVFEHVQGAQPGTALPHGDARVPAATRKMTVVKLDAGPWPWYDNLSVAVIEALVRRTNRRAWRCGWALDKAWSWVEAWRVGKGGRGKMTETIDGPATTETTRRAHERWGINVRGAFDDLMLRAQWETLRRWLILPEPRPSSDERFVTLLTGKLLIQPKDHEWIIEGWAQKFPGRRPEDGPLHLSTFYDDAKGGGLAKLAQG